MKQLNTTELDFNEIRENLKTFFENHPSQEYTDWDFEGSGLSLLLDVLAYNTHYNAILAHTGINETFLDTAQLRSNVVSRAKLLNYTPHSILAAKAVVSLEFDSNASNTNKFILPKGQKFKSVLDGETFFFVTLEPYTAVRNNPTENFFIPEVEIFQGEEKQQNFVINSSKTEEQKIILNDNTADTSTFSIDVFDNPSSNQFETFRLWSTFSNIDGNSPIYFLSENYDQNFEIRFGNGVFGKKPSSQNVIRVSYLSTQGEKGNGANTFNYVGSNPNLLNVSTISKSFKGSESEGIESIRFNAPLSFSAQDRAVTSTDYKTIISSNFPNIESISVWGGQDQTPPEYGKVFIAIKPPAGETLTSAQKNDILDILEKKRVVTIIPEIVDPIFTNLFFKIFFKYNSNVTSLSPGELKSKVSQTISKYENDVLSKFDGVFRYSDFISRIDDTDNAILSSTVRVSVYKDISLTFGNLIPKKFSFDFKLFGDIDSDESFITSSPWEYKGNILKLEDEYIPSNNEFRNIFAFTRNNKKEKVKLFPSVGKLFPKTGNIELSPLPIEQNEKISIFTEPASNDIVAKQNTLLRIDESLTSVIADIDTIAVSGVSGSNTFRTFDK